MTPAAQAMDPSRLEMQTFENEEVALWSSWIVGLGYCLFSDPLSL